MIIIFYININQAQHIIKGNIILLILFDLSVFFDILDLTEKPRGAIIISKKILDL